MSVLVLVHVVEHNCFKIFCTLGVQLLLRAFPVCGLGKDNSLHLAEHSKKTGFVKFMPAGYNQNTHFVYRRNLGKRGTKQTEGQRDRKSTRLNSSHGYISYAVFCLKKKKQAITNN